MNYKKILVLILFVGCLFAQNTDKVANQKSSDYILSQSYQTVENILRFRMMNTMLGIASGEINGVGSVNKFGYAPGGIQDVVTDIWDRANATPTQSVWTAPTQARIHAIVSSSDADSTGNGGALTLRVFGLPDWHRSEIFEDIIMDGTNAVNTDSSYVIIHRMEVLTKGATSSNVGVITATAATDGTVTAQINVGEGQTQMAIYGISSLETAYMTRYYGTINKASGQATDAIYILRVNPEPDSELINFLNKNTRGLQSTGTTSDSWAFDPYFRIPGPAIIKVSAIASVDDIDGSAGFDIILVEN